MKQVESKEYQDPLDESTWAPLYELGYKVGKRAKELYLMEDEDLLQLMTEAGIGNDLKFKVLNALEADGGIDDEKVVAPEEEEEEEEEEGEREEKREEEVEKDDWVKFEDLPPAYQVECHYLPLSHINGRYEKPLESGKKIS